MAETQPNDDYETPYDEWKALLSNVSRETVLCDPFIANGRSEIYMEDLGFDVMTVDDTADILETDFPKDVVIVTNPPFSNFENCMELLVAANRPMAILAPTTIAAKYHIPGMTMQGTKATNIKFISAENKRNPSKFTCVWLLFGWEQTLIE